MIGPFRFSRRPYLCLFVAALLSVVAAGVSATDQETDNPVALAFLTGLPAPQSVVIPWRPGRFTEFQAGTAEENGVRSRVGNLRGQLYRAPRPGPAPYVVLLAGCGGTYGGVNGLWLKLWAQTLQEIGVGALGLDSIEARGVPDGVCGDGSRLWAHRRVDDVYAALNWLATQPQVDRRRVVVMGMSNGARTALLAVSGIENARFHHFAGAVALYPSCDDLPPHALMAPSLLLLGAIDDASFPAKCEQFAAQRHNAPAPPQTHTYAKASHLFDVYPRDENYNASEVLESRRDVQAFLKRVLNIAEPTHRTPTPSPNETSQTAP